LKRPRILIIMSRTGGGHRSAAMALQDALLQLSPHAEIAIADIFAHLPFPLSRVGELYEPVVQYSQGLWQLVWDLTESPEKSDRLVKVIAPLARPTLRNLLQEQRPDVVVSVYPLCVHALDQARRDLGLSIPQITVVVDLVNIHPTWGCSTVDYCVVPTESARRQVLHYGVPKERAKLLGMPVGLQFGSRQDKIALRSRLGLQPELTTLLLMGGAGGVGPLFEVVSALDSADLPLQLMVVTGHNERLHRKMAAVSWRKKVHLFGFVERVWEFMGASDLLLTKAGPQTICEGLSAGLPIVIFDALPGQEADNADFVASHGAGLFLDSPESLASAMQELMASNREQLEEMMANAQAVARPQAALDIAQLILEQTD
jgi:1,2-diacylglycerol 3-beta-galactosyltransferase